MLTKQLSRTRHQHLHRFRGGKAGPQDVCGRADICAARVAKKRASPWPTGLWQKLKTGWSAYRSSYMQTTRSSICGPDLSQDEDFHRRTSSSCYRPVSEGEAPKAEPRAPTKIDFNQVFADATQQAVVFVNRAHQGDRLPSVKAAVREPLLPNCEPVASPYAEPILGRIVGRCAA
jgi:hypothetical protein